MKREKRYGGKMRSKGGCVLRLGVATSVLVGSAHAQPKVAPPAPQAAAYAYTSPVECPQRAEFVARVNDRQSVHSASEVDGALDRLLSGVTIESTGTRGRLYFRDARIAARQVTANTCDEVVTGLALIAGVSLDGPASLPGAAIPEGAGGSVVDARGSVGEGPDVTASRETTPGSTVNATVPPTVLPTRSGAKEQPGAVPKATTQSSVPAVAPSGAPVPNTRRAAASERRERVEATSGARVTRALEPVFARGDTATTSAEPGAAEPAAAQRSQGSVLAVGLGAAGGGWTAFGEPELRADAFLELGDRSQTWAARLGGFGVWNEASALSWSANWATYGARIEACPILGGLGWHVAVCGVAELGSTGVRSASSVGDSVEDTQLLWADGGLGLRVGTPSAWKVNVEGQLDAVVPFTRYKLTFEEPTVALAHVPSIVVIARLGFRWRPFLQ